MNKVMVPKEEDPFIFATQQPSFCVSGSGDFTLEYWQNAFPVEESFLDAFPLMESFDADPALYATHHAEDSWLYGNVCGHGVWNELGSLFDPKRTPLVLCHEENGTDIVREESKVSKRCSSGEEKINNRESKVLTRQIISQYFYMPITQAAKELNVGLTLLKKRCRDLGIRRWPHRKLVSLQTLITNVQELGKVGKEGSEAKMREAVEILEREKKLLEERPEMQLQIKTKRLRQACFKANYKKRKVIGMMTMNNTSKAVSSNDGCCSHGSIDASEAAAYDEIGNEDDDDDEDGEIKSLLSDSYSSSNIMA